MKRILSLALAAIILFAVAPAQAKTNFKTYFDAEGLNWGMDLAKVQRRLILNGWEREEHQDDSKYHSHIYRNVSLFGSPAGHTVALARVHNRFGLFHFGYGFIIEEGKTKEQLFEQIELEIIYIYGFPKEAETRNPKPKDTLGANWYKMSSWTLLDETNIKLFLFDGIAYLEFFSPDYNTVTEIIDRENKSR